MRRLAFAAFAVLLAGCAGYHLGPVNGDPAGARSVQFRPFANRTTEPRVSEYVNEALRKQLQRDGTFRLETHDEGDIVVWGEIERMDRSELSFQSVDVLTPQDYNLALIAHITAYDRTTGKTNVNQRIVGRTAVRIGSDLSSAEREAIPMLAEDLARNAVAALSETPWWK